MIPKNGEVHQLPDLTTGGTGGVGLRGNTWVNLGDYDGEKLDGQRCVSHEIVNKAVCKVLCQCHAITIVINHHLTTNQQSCHHHEAA